MPDAGNEADFNDFLDEDGVLGFENALRIFASTHAPLPGVEAAALPVPESETHVLSLLADSRDQLTDEQWTIVESVIGGPGVPLDQLDVPAGGAVRRPYGARAAQAAPIIRSAVDEWTRRLGRPLSLGPSMLTVVELPLINPETGSRNFADLGNAATAIRLLTESVYDECLIRLNTDAPFNAGMFESQVSHEVFHCFQYDLVNTNPLPRWIVEGLAAYAGEVFAGGTAQSSSWWERWVEEPTRSLTARSYDAIGIYSASAALGHDPFGFADSLLRDPRFETVEAVTGTGIRDQLGTHYANEPGWGGQFLIVGPGAPATKARRSPLTWAGATASFPRVVTPGSIAATAYSFTAPGDVLVVASTGFGGVHFSNGAAERFAGGYLGAFCLLPGGCVCPGEASARDGLVAASADGFVGVGPGDTPEFTSQSLEEYCASVLPTTTLPPDDLGGAGCVVGSWVVDNTAMAQAFQAATAIPGTPSGNQQVTGSFTMQVNADGTIAITVTAWTITSLQTGPEGADILFEVVFAGSTAGSWSATDSTFSTNTAGSYGGRSYITVAGVRTEVTGGLLPSLPIGAATSNAVCTAAGLTLRAGGAGAIDMVFVRVA